VPVACVRAGRGFRATQGRPDREAVLTEEALFNRQGKAVYRLCGSVLYDYVGRPRGFVVGKTVYDLSGQHRGFWQNHVVCDRMCRIIGYSREARITGLTLPPLDVPPLPYKNLPAPKPPPEAVDLKCPAFVPAWSMMPLVNLLPT